MPHIFEKSPYIEYSNALHMNDEQKYQKQFNDGYLLAKHMPELAAKVKDAVPDKDNGFIDGIMQFEKEKDLDRLPSWLKDNRYSSIDKEPDQGKDLDKNDPEISRE